MKENDGNLSSKKRYGHYSWRYETKRFIQAGSRGIPNSLYTLITSNMKKYFINSNTFLHKMNIEQNKCTYICVLNCVMI